jgi:hypothetical protein
MSLTPLFYSSPPWYTFLMSSDHVAPYNPSSRPVPTITYFEKKVTDISGLLMQYIDEAGGSGTVEGNRFAFLLHEVNNTFGQARSEVSLLQHRVAVLEAEAAESVSDVSVSILRSNLGFEGVEAGVVLDDDAVSFVVDCVVRSGWVPPAR